MIYRGPGFLTFRMIWLLPYPFSPAHSSVNLTGDTQKSEKVSGQAAQFNLNNMIRGQNLSSTSDEPEFVAQLFFDIPASASLLKVESRSELILDRVMQTAVHKLHSAQISRGRGGSGMRDLFHDESLEGGPTPKMLEHGLLMEAACNSTYIRKLKARGVAGTGVMTK